MDLEGCQEIQGEGWHFLCRLCTTISDMSATDQHSWLEGIKFAQAKYEDSAAREIASMRTLMENYFLPVTS